MTRFAFGWILLATMACSDDGDTMPTAGAFGATCTTVVDTGSTECASGVCTDSFDQVGHPVCSEKCTGDDSACPEGSEGKKCNRRGYCKP